MNCHCVCHIHVLPQRSMHECNAVTAVLVVQWNLFTLMAIPVNCVATNAVVAAHAHAVKPTRTKHVDSQAHIISKRTRNLKIVSERVGKLVLLPFVIVILCEIASPLRVVKDVLQPWVSRAKKLEVRGTRDPHKRNVVLTKRVADLIVIRLEVSTSTQEATTDDIPGEHHKVRFFSSGGHCDERIGEHIRIVVFSEMKIGELHDLI